MDREYCGSCRNGLVRMNVINLSGHTALAAQLLHSTAGELGNGFLQLRQFSHWMTEGTGTGDLLLVGRYIFQINAGSALQFSHRALQRH